MEHGWWLVVGLMELVFGCFVLNPKTAGAKTPSGGFHLYFDSGDEPIPNSMSKLAKGEDLIGDGSYPIYVNIILAQKPKGMNNKIESTSSAHIFSVNLNSFSSVI